ncbi:MAG TPA: SurA N-terminal domain-containing protein, partial [bacterium]|nr:SurA N-terminal domain-containing protein [bacterium]
MTKVIPILLIFWFTFSSALSAAETQLLDQVVAVVNEEPITQSELDMLLRPIYENFKNEYNGRDLYRKLNDVRRKLLNQLIEDRLVYQEAKKLNIQADEADIERRIEKFKSRFSTAAEMDEALRRQGMTLTFIRDRFRRQAMIENLQDQQVRSKVVVSPGDIETYYAEHSDEFAQSEGIKLRTITLKKSEEAREKGMK